MKPRWMPTFPPGFTPTHVDEHWRSAPAVRGQGTVLLADYPGGLRVLAPPGVSLATDPRTEDPLSFEGWRLAVWRSDVNDQSWIDTRRPDSFQRLSLADVVRLLPPSQWQWVHTRCRRLLLSLVGYVTPIATGSVPDDAQEAWERLEALVAELEVVFARSDWRTMIPALNDALSFPDGFDGRPVTAKRPRQSPPLVDLESATTSETRAGRDDARAGGSSSRRR